MECPWVAQGRKGEEMLKLSIDWALWQSSPMSLHGSVKVWGSIPYGDLQFFFAPCSWLAADVSWQFLKSGIYILKLKFIFEF